MKAQYLERLYSLLSKVDHKAQTFVEASRLSPSSPPSLSLTFLPGDHEIFTLMNQIKASLQNTPVPPEVFGSFAIKLYQSFGEAKEVLLTDVHLSLLVSVHRLSPVVVSRAITDSFLNDLMAEKVISDRIVYDLVSEGVLITHEVFLLLSYFQQ